MTPAEYENLVIELGSDRIASACHEPVQMMWIPWRPTQPVVEKYWPEVWALRSRWEGAR